jgi:hypothetical protein
MRLSRHAFMGAAAGTALARPALLAAAEPLVVAEDGDICKPPAPPAGKYVLDRSLGGLAS